LYVAVLQFGKIKALHRVDARQKKSPASVGGVKSEIVLTLIAPNVIICCCHDGIAAAYLDNNVCTGCGLARVVTGAV
jgi:hypothetical protein